MAVRIDLTFDCANPIALAEFWKLALGYEDEPPPAPFVTREEWLQQFDDEDDGEAAWLHDPAGVGPRLSLLQVPEGNLTNQEPFLGSGTTAAAVIT